MERNKREHHTVPWRYAILRLHEAIETVVPQFNDADSRRFRQGLARVFIDNYAAIPPESIRRLLALHRAGILRILTLGEDYELQRDKRAFAGILRQARLCTPVRKHSPASAGARRMEAHVVQPGAGGVIAQQLRRIAVGQASQLQRFGCPQLLTNAGEQIAIQPSAFADHGFTQSGIGQKQIAVIQRGGLIKNGAFASASCLPPSMAIAISMVIRGILARRAGQEKAIPDGFFDSSMVQLSCAGVLLQTDRCR